MLLLIAVRKFAIWSTAKKLFRNSQWIFIAGAAGLTQIGERSFVLLEAEKRAGLPA
jgi:hypothetical protein